MKTTKAPKPDTAFILNVLTGPNAGASVSLDPGRFSLGSDDDNDVILAGLSPQSLDMKLSAGSAHLTAKSDGAQLRRVGRSAPFPAGQSQTVALPATIQLAPEVIIQLASTLDPAPTWQRTPWLAAAAALVVGCWLGANVFQGDTAAGPAMADAQPTVQSAPAPNAVAATSPQMGCDGDCVENGKRVLRERIAAAGLTGLSLETEGGVLRLTGKLAPDQFDTWRQIRTGFEAEFGRSLPVVASIEAGETQPILSVSSIWLGSRPEVRTKGGNALRIGDSTNDGWVVKSIEKGRIGLEREGQSAEVRF
ncbi:MAG: hypothetical protein DI498_03330 [Paracoccus denitrificans]|nr:MAG: hypothetical protein DI498_03330 [Paracoccus denitrificans]PZO85560.1 MAG: hypothetical protein DI633_03330 [Paracoccus denitrificans]